MIDLVCPWSWVDLADVLAITQIVNALGLTHFSTEDSRGMLWVVSCRSGNLLGVCLSLICERLSFVTQSKIAISPIILGRIGFSARMCRNMIEIRKFSVLRHTVVRVSVLKSKLCNSIPLNPESHSTSLLILDNWGLSLK
jgi:hypothetical protein